MLLQAFFDIMASTLFQGEMEAVLQQQQMQQSTTFLLSYPVPIALSVFLDMIELLFWRKLD